MSSATRIPYPDDWNRIAREVKRRAGWKCQHCGHPHDPKAGYTLTVHHVDGNPQNNQPSNLRALCQRCHMAFVAKQQKYGRHYHAQPTLFEKGETP
jgi:5-methylcytosine-specific restriction endonuclease McrA